MCVHGDRCAAGEMIRIRGDQCVAMEIDALPPKDKQIWKTSTAQQQDRSNKKHKKNHSKLAHKRATILYEEKKVKPDRSLLKWFAL